MKKLITLFVLISLKSFGYCQLGGDPWQYRQCLEQERMLQENQDLMRRQTEAMENQNRILQQQQNSFNAGFGFGFNNPYAR